MEKGWILTERSFFTCYVNCMGGITGNRPISSSKYKAGVSFVEVPPKLHG